MTTSILIIVLCMLASARAQVVPFFKDIEFWMPSHLNCFTEDVLHIQRKHGVCHPYRSEGCNTTTNTCVLAKEVYTDRYNRTADNLVEFKFLQKPYVSTKVFVFDVTLNFNFATPYHPEGVLQLWKYILDSDSIFEFEFQEHEVRPVGPNNDESQMFSFKTYYSGTFVAVYWDHGGTKMGNPLPMYSQPILIPYL